MLGKLAIPEEVSCMGENEPPDITTPNFGYEPQIGEYLGPYILEAFLAAGGTADVYLAQDSRSQLLHAIKILHSSHGDQTKKLRFRREFRALSRLRHPNVLAVYEWGVESDRPWYSMELIKGLDLRKAIQEWEELEPDERFEKVTYVLIRVARALAYIHDRGLVHRDVSPGNIMIEADGGVKLMDFGLVTDRQADLTSVGEVMGTVAYIAPEQIRGDPTDARTDLYALGTVLYQMLTGRKPFNAHTLQGYMEQHLNERPVSPETLDPLVPEQLNRICMRLLEKDPDDRFASASHLLHVLGENAEGESGRWPPRTVGRSTMLSITRELFESLSADRPGGAVLFHGAPGSGRTRLVDLIEEDALRRGLNVARTRCIPDAAPFAVFAPVYQEFHTKGPHSDILEETFHKTIEGVRREKYPVIAAFREMVSANAPCVLIFDDVHHANATTLELLDYLIRNTLEIGEESVVFVLTAKSSAHPTILPQLSSLQRVKLPPLNASEVEEMVLGLLPDAPSTLELARRLYEETGGSPSFLADMLRSLVDDGILKPTGGRYIATIPPEEISYSTLPLPQSLRESLAERIYPLNDNAREVGRLIATARRALSLDALIEACELEEEEVMEALDDLLDADVVREIRTAEGEQVELSHSRFRDVLLEGVKADHRIRQHRQLGEILEAQHRYALVPVVEDLAYHFEQAKVPPKAYAYLIQTAQKHLNRSLFEEGLMYLERCLKMEPEARPFLQLETADRLLTEVRIARARTLHHLGRWDEAMQDAYAARKISDAVRIPDLQSRASGLLGNQLRQTGQVAKAERPLRDALAHARASGNLSLLTKPLYDLGAVLWAKGDLDGAESKWTESLGISRELQDQRAEGRAFNGLGILAICRGRAAEARRRLESSAEIFERVGMIETLAVTRVNLIELYLSIGVLRKAIELAERTITQAREVRHIHGVALGMVWRSRLLLAIGRPEEARRNAQQALRMSKKLGTAEEVMLSLLLLVRIMLTMNMGRFALARAKELLVLLDDVDFEGIKTQATALLARVYVAREEHEKALELMEGLTISTASFPLVRIRTELDVARAWMLLGKKEQAIEALKNCLDLSKRDSFRYYQLSALHELSQALPSSEDRTTYARRAKSLAKSIASSLPREVRTSFLSRGWGVPRGES